ncbi:MAG TPA: molybdopterin-dependent oxidoreductase, partial [Rhizomicrobium sp.]|nr:molybdopterin-dependent oxidoreductase [Rhizomicrobium sp.]
MDQTQELIGEPMGESDLERPAQEDCPCKEGMFPKASRRQVLRGGSLLTAAAASVLLPRRGALAADADDAGSWTVPGQLAKSDYGTRSSYETVVREATPAGTDALTPHQSLWGIITPSGLHFERHHNGVPTIDPAQHRLLIHGMVDRPMKYSVTDLKRFPSVSRTLFIECSGNSGGAARSAALKTAQATHGLTSTSEWTGVRVSTLMSAVGVKDSAAWVLAEGADGAMLSRSVPI